MFDLFAIVIELKIWNDLLSFMFDVHSPYCVLERLANSGLIRKKDVILDYGCLMPCMMNFYYQKRNYRGKTKWKRKKRRFKNI